LLIVLAWHTTGADEDLVCLRVLFREGDELVTQRTGRLADLVRHRLRLGVLPAPDSERRDHADQAGAHGARQRGGAAAARYRIAARESLEQLPHAEGSQDGPRPRLDLAHHHASRERRPASSAA